MLEERPPAPASYAVWQTFRPFPNKIPESFRHRANEDSGNSRGESSNALPRNKNYRALKIGPGRTALAPVPHSFYGRFFPILSIAQPCVARSWTQSQSKFQPLPARKPTHPKLRTIEFHRIGAFGTHENPRPANRLANLNPLLLRFEFNGECFIATDALCQATS
jgi:hypothetical protein